MYFVLVSALFISAILSLINIEAISFSKLCLYTFFSCAYAVLNE